MGATPHDIAVDINDLLKAGRSQMPAVAAEYRAASSKLLLGTAGFALMRDSSLGIAPTGIFSTLVDAMNAIDGMLQQEAATMDAIGEALVTIAIKEFHDTDENARREYVGLYGKMEKA